MAVQDQLHQSCLIQDAPCLRTTSRSIAARTLTVLNTAAAAPATSRSAATTARITTASCTATPARPGSLSSRGHPSSTPNSPTTKSWGSWSTLTRVAGPDRPPAWWGSPRTQSPGWRCWPVSTPRTPTTRSWLFPPATREVQFDEKWAFVGKKQKNCNPNDPDDDQCGDYWDFVAFDAEHRLVLAVVPGARSAENAEAIVAEAKERLGEQPPAPVTSDELPAHAPATE